MEFCEKLQALRKARELTQEELAEALYVSRTAISKWESGRGFPNIESLKAIARFFGVTVDELLSGEQVLSIAEEDSKQKQAGFRGMVWGLMDLSAAMFFFLPLFGQQAEDGLQSVSLLGLTQIQPWLKIAYFGLIIAIVVAGVLSLALQNYRVKALSRSSLLCSIAADLLFILSRQPYAAAFIFVFLIIKVFMLIKKQ